MSNILHIFTPYKQLKLDKMKTINIKTESAKFWGKNKYGQTIREHDKLFCGNGLDTWFTHVIFDGNKWHREGDYMNSKVVGKYEM